MRDKSAQLDPIAPAESPGAVGMSTAHATALVCNAVMLILAARLLEEPS